MIRNIVFRNQIDRDLKRMRKRGKDTNELLAVAHLLAVSGFLESRYRPHKLSGEYDGFWECHIEPDWLLIYDVTDTAVLLVRTGTHADLFE